MYNITILLYILYRIERTILFIFYEFYWILFSLSLIVAVK